MSEAGPSSATATPSSSLAGTSTSTSVSRHSRFQFPDSDQHAAHSRIARPNGPTRVVSSGLGQVLPSRRADAVSGGAGSSSSQAEEIRRRVKSVDAVVSPMGASRMQRAAEQDIDGHKRTMSTTRRPVGKGKGIATLMDPPSEFPSVPFSDEYDLSHEDPRILEDVQRALKLKARREARLKALQTNNPARDSTAASSDQASGSSFSTYSSPVRTKLAEPPPISTPVGTHNGESEIDFSPSVGAVPLHPVPSSSNGGATLDWTGSASEDDRDKRWSISITKRRHRDKSSFYASSSIVEKQESLYVDKLARIRAKVKPHTLRKAAITGEQLQRRYAALLGASGTNKTPVTILGAGRWYSKQESVVQASLDNAEPLTWLKHLIEKRGKPTSRLPWHLTALIIEEYAKSLRRPEPMRSIPENETLGDSTHAPDSSPFVISVVSPESKATSKSPSSGSWSWSPPPQALEPSLSRKRQNSDDTPSFEPQVDSGKESAGTDSRRSSLEPGRHRIQSLTYGTDSTRSSMHGSLFNGSRSLAVSPVSSRMQFRDLAKRIRRKAVAGSEDGMSSARGSISEHSQEDLAISKNKRPTRTDTLSEEALSDRGISSGEGPLTATQAPSPYTTAPDPTPNAGSSDSRVQSPVQTRPRRSNLVRRRRMSLPSLNQLIFEEEEQRRQQQTTEEAERQEYDRKIQILEDTLRQNHRTRQLLQRVGANIREYENVQSRLAVLLGKPHTPISQDVLDAFSHDPASVTGGTRRFKSWHAVEDIQDRIIRQRDTLQEFVASISTPDSDLDQPSVFKELMASLTQSLEQLEQRRQDIAHKAEEVAEALARVKEIHGNVKIEYNEVLAHTSLVYPQISYIVALEASYRNKYQQIWDIGLDALTLLLDTVTPVWRNYGKVIGEDVQDFLIIPWYRNEFTGEQHRYPITRLPQRSLRHWLGLLVFTFITVCITALQLGAAVSSSINYNLPWMAHTGFRWIFVPFFAVGLVIQWSAVLVECCVVLGEFAVIAWWIGWVLRIFH